MTSAPSTLHQLLLGNLHLQLAPFFKDKCNVFLAPFDVRMCNDENYENTNQVVQPDISVICDDEKLSKNGCIGAPDLIVEILSPSTALKDRNHKFNLYQKHGVKEYWLVDPYHQTIEIYYLQDGFYQERKVFGKEDKLTSFLYPELSIDLTVIFKQ